jgi:hypothetical protein
VDNTMALHLPIGRLLRPPAGERQSAQEKSRGPE